jgi:3-oxoacyl-[acyl-carrier-protein] synthase-3
MNLHAQMPPGASQCQTPVRNLHDYFKRDAMSKDIHSIIVGTGSYMATRRVHNRNFLRNEFYDPDGKRLEKTNEEIIRKFEKITGIAERRYVTDDLVVSDIAFRAAKNAFDLSKIDKESLDYIIVAHNFGDVRADNKRSAFVPSLGSRVKQKLGIENPRTIPYDIVFGCPGWLQAMIQADYFLKSGDTKRILVIGSEVLSRISDPHDRDSMIYADGAGATIVEAITGREPVGILSHATRSDTLKHAYMLRMGKSYNPHYKGNELFLKMDGHKLYEYALMTVPKLVKESLVKAGLSLGDIKRVLLHQANAKMDEAILKRLYKLHGEKEVPPYVMPMTISWLGNSSVATLPTLLDLLLKGKLENHELKKGDIVVFASVGAGMNINSMVYKMP